MTFLDFPGPSVFLLLASILWYLVLSRSRRSAKSSLPLPPGPRPWPLVGNLGEFPLQLKRVAELVANYGDVVHLSVFGTNIILLGTHQAAVDLLEKRSAIYSDRDLYEYSKLTNFDWLFSVLPYGRPMRRVRGAFHRSMSASAIYSYRHIQHEEVKRHLLRLLENPRDFTESGRKMVGAMIIRVVYGLDVYNADEKYMRIAEKSMECFSAAFDPGRYLVQVLPWLRFVPAWFPGAGFQREFAGWKREVTAARDLPWEAAVEKKEKPGHLPAVSVFSMQMERIENGQEDEMTAKCTAASAYLGGSDTTSSTLQTFMAVMASFPHIQRQAQAELDAVIGSSRLPTLDDKPLLPFTTALVKECFRWRNVTPLGFVHTVREGDDYKGYFIPKGSTILPITWLAANDPRYFRNPGAFDPGNFMENGKLSDKVLDPSDFAFGYGRRICPGRFFAQASVFLMISNILQTFTIEPAEGQTAPLNVKMTSGVVSHPRPFECVIKPRSAAAEALVRNSCAELA